MTVEMPLARRIQPGDAVAGGKVHHHREGARPARDRHTGPAVRGNGDAVAAPGQVQFEDFLAAAIEGAERILFRRSRIGAKPERAPLGARRACRQRQQHTGERGEKRPAVNRRRAH